MTWQEEVEGLLRQQMQTLERRGSAILGDLVWLQQVTQRAA